MRRWREARLLVHDGAGVPRRRLMSEVQGEYPRRIMRRGWVRLPPVMERTLRDDLKWALCVLVGVTAGYFGVWRRRPGGPSGGLRRLCRGDRRIKHSPPRATSGGSQLILKTLGETQARRWTPRW